MPDAACANLLPHEMHVSLYDTLMKLHEEAAKEAQNLRLMLEEECQKEDSAGERLIYQEMPDERMISSQCEFYVEEADTVEIGTCCQALMIPECQPLPCQAEF